VAASGFTFVSWRQSCCVRGRAGTMMHGLADLKFKKKMVLSLKIGYIGGLKWKKKVYKLLFWSTYLFTYKENITA
jgi:hypothetical protein